MRRLIDRRIDRNSLGLTKHTPHLGSHFDSQTPTENVKSELMRIFVSYCRQDYPVAVELVSRLRRAGVEVWIDVDSVAPGSVWREQIRNGIMSADCYMPLISTRFLTSEFCYLESESAIIFRSNYIAPVLIEDCQNNLEHDSKFSWLTQYHPIRLSSSVYPTEGKINRAILTTPHRPCGARGKLPISDFAICATHQDRRFASLIASGLEARGLVAIVISEKSVTTARGKKLSRPEYETVWDSKFCIFVLSQDPIRASSTLGRFALACDEAKVPLLAVATPELSKDVLALEATTQRVSAMDRVFGRMLDRQLFLYGGDVDVLCEGVIAAVQDETPEARDERFHSWRGFESVSYELARILSKSPE